MRERRGAALFSLHVGDSLLKGFTQRPGGAKLTIMGTINREPEIVTRNGKPVSVILPIKEYQELLERAEDADDVAWLKRARRKKLHNRPLEDYLRKSS